MFFVFPRAAGPRAAPAIGNTGGAVDSACAPARRPGPRERVYLLSGYSRGSRACVFVRVGRGPRPAERKRCVSSPPPPSPPKKPFRRASVGSPPRPPPPFVTSSRAKLPPLPALLTLLPQEPVSVSSARGGHHRVFLPFCTAAEAASAATTLVKQAQVVKEKERSLGGAHHHHHHSPPTPPACHVYVRTGHCRFGSACAFSHPPEHAVARSPGTAGLASRPGQPHCSFYARTGTCKFGLSCKFDHPRGVEPRALGPCRPGRPPCPYQKVGTCKYGMACKYDHT